ncbi:MAG TPA: hypothetical protein VGR11_17350 [Solirubrobacteraceae bacterium]|nr:hypothetical protein [Solirubrobacteraceae bacterium]
MSTTSTGLGGDRLVTEEVVRIVVRASELGFSPWRVGIALRIAPMELEWICAHLTEQKPRRQVVDGNVSRRAFAVAGERVDQEVVEHDRQL